MKFMEMSAEEALLFQERALSVIECDYETGLFRWIKIIGRCKKCWFAGSKDSSGYTVIHVLGHCIRGHQLAWIMYYGAIPEFEIDHKNGIKSDNRIENLRDATRAENLKNARKSRANTSGYTGVNWDKQAGKWTTTITVNYITITIGLFREKDEAIAAREAANIKYGYDPSHGKRI